MSDSHSAMQSKPPNHLPEKAPTALEASYEPMESHRGLFQVVDAVLKQPGQVLHDLLYGKRVVTTAILLVITAIGLTAIGLMMASFSGGAQFGAVPLKIVLGTLLSAVICLPSLYILLCLSGGSQTFPQVFSVLCQCLALAGILFAGFLPVAWIFSQATDSIVFMGCLYLLIWGTGIYFGLRMLRQAFSFLNKRSMGTLKLWGVIFVMVILQMSTTLRPLLGTNAPLSADEKKFFAAHWLSVAGQTAGRESKPAE